MLWTCWECDMLFRSEALVLNVISPRVALLLVKYLIGAPWGAWRYLGRCYETQKRIYVGFGYKNIFAEREKNREQSKILESKIVVNVVSFNKKYQESRSVRKRASFRHLHTSRYQTCILYYIFWWRSKRCTTFVWQRSKKRCKIFNKFQD